jgi:DNA replication and repair protein RecF
VPLNQVRIHSFRCLSKVDLPVNSKRTYIFGPNGAGKTSLLETIYLLGRGRSFRTRQSRRLIQHGQESFAVYGALDLGGVTHHLGVGRSAGGLELRLDGKPAQGISALARLLPVHVIEPSMHSLIEGGPKNRRQFLDWGVFHVKQDYLSVCRRYRRILGQRNMALKTHSGEASWNESLLEAGLEVDQARSHYVSQLANALVGLGEALLGRPLEIAYRRGWRKGQAFEEALEASFNKDSAIGATQVGPHRADLMVSLGTRGVREEVSRGQQKLIAAGLVLAQIRVFASNRDDGGILLVDDPAAELDKSSLGALISVLDELPAQQVLTSLEESILPPASGCSVFHVEQGKVLSMVQ